MSKSIHQVQFSKMYSRFLQHSNLKDHTYQRDGVNWCLSKENDNKDQESNYVATGAILADEMGLGKTITMLATIALNINHHKQTLIVVPPVLIDQWASQCATILGHVPFVFYGTHKKHIDVVPNDAYIVITSYSVMSNPTLVNKTWDRIIFDEAHHMRNPNTRNFRVANTLKTSFKWLLTGTPMQNKRRDLYSLFNLINIPREVYIVDENRPKLLNKHMLRRTKASVGLDKQMPPLKIHPEMIKWSDPQEKDASEKIHSLLNFSHVKSKATDVDSSTYNVPPIVLLMKAKQMCVMGSSNKGSQRKLKCKLSTVLRRIITSSNNADTQTKKLIFCHFRNEMDIIEEQLKLHNIKSAKIDGRIPSKKERSKILEDDSNEVLIIQLRVGCEGLNLQKYSDVYFVSPTWNPFIEDQAIARCYRMGQKKTVNVYRFYMEGFGQEQPTFSQDMYTAQVQETKKHLESELLS